MFIYYERWAVWPLRPLRPIGLNALLFITYSHQIDKRYFFEYNGTY